MREGKKRRKKGENSRNKVNAKTVGMKNNNC